MTVDIENLRVLLDVLVERDIAEFEHEADGVRVKIVRSARVAAAPHFAYAAPPAAMAGSAYATPPAVSAASVPENSSDAIDITSPFVGTFYRAPSPDAPAFVEVGSVIRPGQTLCIIEAMKLMNEIEAECTGTIIEVFVQSGKAVEFGQKLYRVKKA